MFRFANRNFGPSNREIANMNRGSRGQRNTRALLSAARSSQGLSPY